MDDAMKTELLKNFARAKAGRDAMRSACRACFALPIHEYASVNRVWDAAGVEIYPDERASMGFCRRCAQDMAAASDFRARCALSESLLESWHRSGDDEAIEIVSSSDEEDDKSVLDTAPPTLPPPTPPSLPPLPPRPLFSLRSLSSAPSPRDEQEFYCHHCSKKFLTKQGIISHVKTHVSPQFECGRCKKSFRRHKHCMEYECEMCGRPFCLQTQLVKHRVNEHLVVGEHQCVLCKKRFLAKREFDYHKKSIYMCTLCGKSVCGYQRIQRHVNGHKPEERFGLAGNLFCLTPY